MIWWLGTALIVSLAVNTALFALAYPLKTDKLTDASYALSFVALAVWGLGSRAGNTYRWLIFVMVLFWALRLGGFLLVRIWHMGRDKRFDGVRENFGKFARFWLGQAISVWIIMLPALMVLHSGRAARGRLVWLGAAVWLAGLALEALADWQKYRFNADPGNAGRWINSGIWAYSRHPNYFGEMLVWAGVYLVAFMALPGWQKVIGLASPVFIVLLLRYVTGVPPLENAADQRWGKDSAYQNYRDHTNLLVPGPRKA